MIREPDRSTDDPAAGWPEAENTRARTGYLGPKDPRESADPNT